MKINYLAYLDPFVYSGGGELANRAWIEAGRKLGHDIRVSARRWGKLSKLDGPRYRLHPNPDMWILSDIFNVPEDHLSFDEHVIRRIVENELFVHVENAWVDICERPYLPCGGDASKCEGNCSLGRARWLYSHARVSVFVSPLHERVAKGLLRADVVGESFPLRPCVDTSLFRNEGEERDIEYLYVGTISHYKGYHEVKRRFGHREDFVFVGKNMTAEDPFGRHIPHLPHHQLRALYNRAKRFVHLPYWIEPQGRTVVEAALSGCQIIGNDNVGALSFGFDISDPGIIADAPYHFWRELLARW